MRTRSCRGLSEVDAGRGTGTFQETHPDKDHKMVQCEELNDAVQEILRLDNGEVTDTELQQLERLRKRFYQLHDEIDDPVITASHSGTCWKDE